MNSLQTRIQLLIRELDIDEQQAKELQNLTTEFAKQCYCNGYEDGFNDVASGDYENLNTLNVDIKRRFEWNREVA